MVLWRCLLLLSLFIACEQPVMHTPATATVAGNTSAYPTTLPERLTGYIKACFPQWRFVEKNDYSKTWWSFYDSSYNPCWARTDINDDELADYAVWLIKDKQQQLVICTGGAGNSFTHFIVQKSQQASTDREPNLRLGVAIVPPAQGRNTDTLYEIRMEDSLQVDKLLT
jgi:hypothetical protein